MTSKNINEFSDTTQPVDLNAITQTFPPALAAKARVESISDPFDRADARTAVLYARLVEAVRAGDITLTDASADAAREALGLPLEVDVTWIDDDGEIQ